MKVKNLMKKLAKAKPDAKVVLLRGIDYHEIRSVEDNTHAYITEPYVVLCPVTKVLPMVHRDGK